MTMTAVNNHLSCHSNGPSDRCRTDSTLKKDALTVLVNNLVIPVYLDGNAITTSLLHFHAGQLPANLLCRCRTCFQRFMDYRT